MKHFFHNLFYIPKYGKMKESAFFAHLAASVGVIVLSLTAMSFSAFAYFSSTMSATPNTFVAASYNCNVIIKQNDRVVEMMTLGRDTVSLPQGTYQVAITQIEDELAASTGFCVLEIDGQRYYTAQISALQGLSFELRIDQPEQIVEMFAHWGTSSYYVTESDSSADKSPYYITQDSLVFPVDDGVSTDTDPIPSADDDASAETDATGADSQL